MTSKEEGTKINNFKKRESKEEKRRFGERYSKKKAEN